MGTMVTCVFEDGGKTNLRHVVVDSLIVKDGKILLVKRSKKLRQGGKWALPGGYLDRNETTTQGAAREALEETGWETTNLKLFTIIDSLERNEDGQQNVSFVYVGTATKKVQAPDWESSEVKWFAHDNMPPSTEIAFDHANIIKLYQKYLAKNLPLPLL